MQGCFGMIQNGKVMKKQNNIEVPLNGPDKDFRRMFVIGLGLIAGVSLTITSVVAIIMLLIFYIGNNFS
jgi:hypothetical protein